uniref:Uncharacterized protein n=1 Tax=Panagrolaimus sp. PS1159 TaxID=55785 RepID=A0AC35FCE5_9BILA
MTKLTVVVLLGLIGVAIAHYNAAKYGDIKKYFSSREEDNKCKLDCTYHAAYVVTLNRLPSVRTCNSGSNENRIFQCATCCEGWGLQRGIEKDAIVHQICGAVTPTIKCICCEQKCN